MTSTLLGAGIFGAIGMLAWAAAALIPLLLHLWNRRQHKTAPWAAMEFLLAAVQEQAKHVRLEQILLLLLRMAIPIVLALALADPIWQMLPSIGSSLGSRVPHHHLFVIDTSYSMGYRVADRTRLEQAQQLVRDIMDESPQGDGFTVVNMSNPSEAVISLPAFSAADAMAEVASLQLRDNTADLASALDLAKHTITRTKADFPRLRQHRIYLLSDMGRTTWDAANQPIARKRIGEIESLADIFTIDVGAGSARNLGITSAQRNTPIVTPTTNVVWHVNVERLAAAAGGNDMSPSAQIEMLVNGKLTSKQTVTIEQGSPTVVQFQYQFGSLGEHAIEFRTEDDELPVDNQHYELLTVRDTVKVLCGEGRAGAARNVALALAPTDASNIDVRIVPDHRLNEAILSDYDTLFLCNVRRFTAERASQLRDYLKCNRGIVMFLGDQASPENYNQLLGGGTEQSSILPAKLVEVAPYASYQLAPENYQHPMIWPFRGQERAGLLTTPIWNYWRLQLDPFDLATTNSVPKSVLKFANGDPAIVEHSVLGGRLILFAMPASEQSLSRQGGQLRPWTAWSAWPSFPPLVQEALAFSLESRDKSRNVQVGTPITASLRTSSGARFVSIRNPTSARGGTHEGVSRRVAVQEENSPPSWIYNETYHSGFYEVTIPDSEETGRFAVNLADTRESQLERVSIADLPSQFQQNSITASSDGDKTDLNLATTPLFRMMLGLLLVLLLTESYFAWHLGNARS